tara:strand:- start:721 stop:1002 length:282 start_codon:yes stop_codon:yes gene_type:complete
MENNGNRDEIFIFTTGTWEGKNLYYLLKYYDFIHGLSFEVKKFYNYKNSKDSLLLFSQLDLNNFSNQKHINYKSTNLLSGFYITNLFKTDDGF